MTMSEAIEIAMVAITAAKQQAVKKEEAYNQTVLAPALLELERETGEACALLRDPNGMLEDWERPDVKFNEALEVLGKNLGDFQDFEETNGEETKWELIEFGY